MIEPIIQEVHPNLSAHLHHYKPKFTQIHLDKELLFSEPIDFNHSRGRYFSFHELEEELGVFESGVYLVQESITESESSLVIELIPEDKSWRISQEEYLSIRQSIPDPEISFTQQNILLIDKHSPSHGPFPQLGLEHLTIETRDYISSLKDFDFFWTNNATAEYYRAQARLGFIAVSSSGKYKNYLFPQLQYDYAILFWENLRYDRSVWSKLQMIKAHQLPVSFEVTQSLDTVIPELQLVRGSNSWLSPIYLDVLTKLTTQEEREKDPSFRLWSTIVRWENKPVAGELGYTIGRTYTSLSGFFHREHRQWNHLGKVQMVLLANHLEQVGLSFWNLGHPHMYYKQALGAKILPRKAFLEIWDKGVQEPPVDIAIIQHFGNQ
jgi:hypothetical protein